MNLKNFMMPSNLPKLNFIKLGGSCITDKSRPGSFKSTVIKRIAQELAAIYKSNTNSCFIVGNGAGGFGHFLAHKSRQDDGTYVAKDMVAIQVAVRQLNARVTEFLAREGLPILTIHPSSSGLANKTGKFMPFSLIPFADALKSGVLVSVYGDILLSDNGRYRICSTEQIFIDLAVGLKSKFQIGRVILLSDVDGVYDKNKRIIKTIASEPSSVEHVTHNQKQTYDVTGGMQQKIKSAQMMAKIAEQVWIADGRKKGTLAGLFESKHEGTLVKP